MKKRIANTAGTAAKRIMPQFSLSRVKADAGAKVSFRKCLHFQPKQVGGTRRDGRLAYKMPPFTP